LPHINSLPNHTDSTKIARDRAIIIFGEFGVSIADFDRAVLPTCRKEMDGLSDEYESETRSWVPFSHLNKVAVAHEQEYRSNYNKQYYEKIGPARDRQNACFFELSQKLPQHSPEILKSNARSASHGASVLLPGTASMNKTVNQKLGIARKAH